MSAPIEFDAAAVARSLPIAAAIAAMDAALKAQAAGEVLVPLRSRWSATATGEPTVLTMPASAAALGLMVVKVLTILENNRERGLPVIQGEMTVYELDTGTPIARLDAEEVTKLRTAGCTGVATALLAVPDADTLAVFGHGAQARHQVEAVRAVRPIERVLLFGRDPARTRGAAGSLSAATGLDVIPSSGHGSLRQAQIVCTLTNSRAPLFALNELHRDAHVNAIGAYSPDMRELPSDLVETATILVDHADFCLTEAGDLIRARLPRTPVELGACAGLPIRRGRTVFKSVGNAGQDLFAAAAILGRFPCAARDVAEARAAE